MATYAFQDVTATLAGSDGVIDLGYGASDAKEGITVTLANARNRMTVGADGEYMHSLSSDHSGTVTVRLLQTSPANAKLQALYNSQTLASTDWGNNTITIYNYGNDEQVVCSGCAFQKAPDRTYAEEGQTQTWVFDCGKIDFTTGYYVGAGAE